MAKRMAEKIVDKAYSYNANVTSFYQRMIMIHVIVAIILGIIALVIKGEVGLIEIYVLPALGYFINAHKEAVKENSNILTQSNDSIQKANDQAMIKHNLREQKILERVGGKLA